MGGRPLRRTGGVKRPCGRAAGYSGTLGAVGRPFRRTGRVQEALLKTTVGSEGPPVGSGGPARGWETLPEDRGGREALPEGGRLFRRSRRGWEAFSVCREW